MWEGYLQLSAHRNSTMIRVISFERPEDAMNATCATYHISMPLLLGLNYPYFSVRKE